jgi:hypothetical protein
VPPCTLALGKCEVADPKGNKDTKEERVVVVCQGEGGDSERGGRMGGPEANSGWGSELGAVMMDPGCGR